jgi:hypothetical protein
MLWSMWYKTELPITQIQLQHLHRVQAYCLLPPPLSWSWHQTSCSLLAPPPGRRQGGRTGRHIRCNSGLAHINVGSAAGWSSVSCKLWVHLLRARLLYTHLCSCHDCHCCQCPASFCAPLSCSSLLRRESTPAVWVRLLSGSKSCCHHRGERPGSV